MTAFEYSLEHGARSLVKIQCNSVHGVGKVNPRFAFNLGCRTWDDKISVQLLSLRLDVLSGSELLATGSLKATGQSLTTHANTVNVEAVLLPGTLAYLDETVRDNDLSIGLEFHGQVRVGGDLSSLFLPSSDAGEYQILPVHSSVGSLTVPHSDWVKRMLEPLGVGRHIFLTLRVPAPGSDPRWDAALAHLSAADGLYRDGQDEAVLQRCYNAFESLAGAPKGIFDGVNDVSKRSYLDGLLSKTKEYMHAGRHVGKSATGEFDVSHRDSTFALGMTKMWLTYISRLVND